MDEEVKLKIEKRVGNFTVQIWTAGFPYRGEIFHDEPNGTVAKLLAFPAEEELRDLTYAIERALALLAIETKPR